MEGRRWVAGGLVLVMLLAAAFWLLSRKEPGLVAPLVNPASQEGQTGANAATGDATAPPAPVGTAAVTDEPARTAVAAPVPARKTAILRGRCVDGDGKPLAGCTVRLHGWGANQERTDAWLLDHGSAPQWEDPDKVVTEADGRFEFTFWPPPPFQFSLDVTRDGCGAMSGRWSSLEEGSTTDVGDVLMATGVQVSGRVVDTEGVPQAKAYVSLRRTTREDLGATRATPEPVKPAWGSQALCDANGAFLVRGWLVPGTYSLEVLDRSLVEPKSLELTAERPMQDITVIVKATKDVVTISGRVVDETGLPVARAQVEDRSPASGRMASAHTRRDGTFEMKLPEGAVAKTASLVVWATGCEADAEPRVVPWGSKDVEFQVTRGATLTLRVTDQDNAPVLTYTVRLIPRNRGRFSSDDAKALAQGQHDNGIVTLQGFTRGDWLLIVDFPSGTGLESLFEPLQQTVNAPRRLDLRAGAAAQRILRVVGADGAPIAGSKVQLCETFGSPLTERRMVMRRQHWLWNAGGGHALVLFEGVTDAAGRVSLTGPGDHGLGVCLLGPGHLPLQREGIRLDIAEELVIEVSIGARLVGKVTPPEALTELRRLAQVADGAPFPAEHQPRLRLRGQDNRWFPPSGVNDDDCEALRLREDGSFDASGLPVGSWQVELVHFKVTDRSSSSQGFGGQNVVLVDGQTTELQLDLERLLPGTIEALVLHNGEPLANAVVTLRDEQQWMNLTTDAAGRFTQTCRAGEFTLLVQRPSNGRMLPMLRCATPVQVVRGQTTRQTFAVSSAAVVFTVLDPDGKPAAGVGLFTRPGNDQLPPTDEHGKVEVEVTAENVTVQTLPQRLMDNDARSKLMREAASSGNRDPFAPLWLTVGTLAIVPGQTNTLTIRLPPEWRQ